MSSHAVHQENFYEFVAGIIITPVRILGTIYTTWFVLYFFNSFAKSEENFYISKAAGFIFTHIVDPIFGEFVMSTIIFGFFVSFFWVFIWLHTLFGIFIMTSFFLLLILDICISCYIFWNDYSRFYKIRDRFFLYESYIFNRCSLTF